MRTWVYAPPWGIRAVAVVAMVLLGAMVLRALRERQSRVAATGGGLRPRLRRQWAAVLLRALALAGLLFVALNPTALLPSETGAKPKLVVLIDTSSSMATADVEGRPRLEAALAVLGRPRTWDSLGEAFQLDVRSFGRTWRAADLSRLTPQAATGKGSDIASALVGAIDGPAGRTIAPHTRRPAAGPGAALNANTPHAVPQAGVLLVSDGRATSEGAADAARLALARSVPVWTWCLGGAVPRRDLWIDVSSQEALAFAGAQVHLAATLRQVGYPRRSFRVELLKDGKVIDTQDAVPDASGAARVRAKVTAPNAGEHRYVFRVAPQSDEADATNNERSIFLRVVGKKVRVLLAEGQPHWDTKFLVQSLKRNPRVDLTAAYRLGPKRYFAVLSSRGKQTRRPEDVFPRSAEAMMAYDIVVLGRGAEAFFEPGTDKLLTEFVSERGGGLIFARGKAYGGRFLPIAKLEPVVWGDGLDQDVRLYLTDAGRECPVFEFSASSTLDDLIARLPALDRAARTTGEKPLAVVLATADGSAGAARGTIVMAYQRYGQGKVVTINANGLWRWAFREKGKQEEEFVYSQFWASLLRWMLSGSDFLPGADVALRSSRRRYTDEQPLEFLITTKGLDRQSYRPRLTIRGGGQTIEVEPRESRGGARLAEAGPFPPGTYEILLKNNIGTPAELRTTVEVVSASVENRNLSADPELMRRLAELADGQALSPAEVADLPAVVKRWRATRQISTRKSSLWDRWWLLAGIVAAFGAEWFLRRREGLL